VKNTVIINGRYYDAATGEPVANAAPVPARHAPRTMQDVIAPPKANATNRTPVVKPAVKRPQAHKAHNVHRATEKSRTLHRAAIKKPAPQAPAAPQITKFAHNKSRPAALVHKPVAVAPRLRHTTPVATHTKPAAPVVVPRPAPAQAAPMQQPAANMRQLKEDLIKKQLEAARHDHPTHHKQRRGIKQLLTSRPRALHVVTACFALLLLGGYFSYLNMPNLSVRVAANRAGIDANFPEYQPDGYRFVGPVAYSPGEVRLEFDSNSSNAGYEITQRASNWDSQAVLDNYVVANSPSYLTYQEQGLTIYTFNNQAAWVNGGVLYTIKGDAPLSSDQVLKIATSL
jgi:hypothetical protein